ncbi:MAG: DUF4830 domain-containing protein [Acutalibacteraceae bacterium]
MFVCSLKTTKKQLLSAAACLVLIVAMLTAAFCFPLSSPTAVNAVTGDTDETRAAFLRSIGYEAVLPAVSVKEILLPDSFDSALADYNELQKQAGFDLSGYAGQRVKYWTYDLAEHPFGEPAQAHLYVYNGAVIGGDISATAAGGFCEPLQKQVQTSC